MSAGIASLAQGIADPSLLERILKHIAEVEVELRRQVRSQVPLVAKVGSHTLDAGGKRLRPALVTLSADATGLPFDENRARLLGACMEMIHMATLIHDDVIDHAQTRRGVATAAAVYGNTASILTGDVLLAKAMAILAKDGDIRIIRQVADMVVEMAEGEVLELESRGRFDLSEEEHLEILRMKTALFIQTCCQVGGMVAGADNPSIGALGAYGYHLGMAFQIVDDLLDYRGDHVKTGKPRAIDFREGCATLPLILARSELTHEELNLARTGFGNGMTEDHIHLLCQWMSERGVFEAAQARAEEEIDKAKAGLASLPPSSESRLLGAVADFVVRREA